MSRVRLRWGAYFLIVFIPVCGAAYLLFNLIAWSLSPRVIVRAEDRIAFEQLSARLSEVDQIKVQAGSAKYLIRSKHFQSEEDIQKEVAKLRGKNKGPNEAEDLREYEQNLRRRQLMTYFESALVSGDRFRLERSVDLGEEKSLSQLKALYKDEILQGKKPLAMRQVAVWNGESSKEFSTNSMPLPKGDLPAITKTFIVAADKIAGPMFAEYGRLSPLMLKHYAIMGYVASIQETKTDQGEEAVQLQFASHGATQSIQAEYVLLPAKGYAISKSDIKKSDVLSTKEEFDNFVQTNIGIWLPLHAIVEKYLVTADGLRLDTRTEYLALEAPQLNIEVNEGSFELVPPPDSIVLDTRKQKDGKLPVELGSDFVEEKKPIPTVVKTESKEGSQVSQTRLIWTLLAVFAVPILVGLYYLVAAARRIRKEMT